MQLLTFKQCFVELILVSKAPLMESEIDEYIPKLGTFFYILS